MGNGKGPSQRPPPYLKNIFVVARLKHRAGDCQDYFVFKYWNILEHC